MSDLPPEVARRRLGALLRTARDVAGATLEQAGEYLQRSAATVHRLERGLVAKPRKLEVAHLLDFYASLDARAAPAAARAEAAQLADAGRRDAWYSPFRDVMASEMVPDHVRRFVDYEASATAIDAFETDVIPGLLQTEGYAAAVTETFFPDQTPEMRRRFVKFRLERQDVLTRPNPVRLHVVLSEIALRRRYGDVTVMRDQLEALVEWAEGSRSNVTLQIVPASLTIPAVLGGPFQVMRFDDANEENVVYLEGRAGAQYLTGTARLAEFDGMFADLATASLRASETTAHLREVIDGLS